MKTINIGSITSRAWNLTINNWPIFILLAIISNLLGSIGTSFDADLFQEYNLSDPTMISTAFSQAMHINPWVVTLGFLLTIYINIVTYRMLVNCARTGKPYESMGNAFKIDFAGFAFFLGVSLLMGIVLVITYLLGVGIGVGITAIIANAAELPVGVIVLLGIVFVLLCCIPAIIIAVRWAFAPIIIATEKVPFLDAFRISWRITKGNVWKIVLLALASFGIIILGFCACIIGVFLAVVVVKFMFTLAYTDLKDANDEPAADIAAPVMESYEK